MMDWLGYKGEMNSVFFLLKNEEKLVIGRRFRWGFLPIEVEAIEN